MLPSVGRIVLIRLSAGCAANINRDRQNVALFNTGNAASEGEIFPMIITKVWSSDPTELTAVNGQIFLDGNDVLWATSVQQGTSNGQWYSPVGE